MLSSRCTKCKTPREPDGKVVLVTEDDAGKRFVVRTPQSCECGCDRVKVVLRWDFR